VYALAAVMHTAVTGRAPPPAVARLLADSYAPLAAQPALRKRFSARLLAAIDAGLAVRPKARPQSMDALRKLLGLNSAAATAALTSSSATPQARPGAGEVASRGAKLWRPAILFAPLLLAAGLVWWIWSSQQPPAEALPAKAPPAETPPAETPPVETPPVETPPVETPPAETPPAETPPPLPPPPPVDTNQPVALNAAEAARLSAQLQSGPQPASCRAGSAKIRKDNNLTAKQAVAIARQAWPDLCAPPPKPAVDTPAPVESKSLDQLYKERSASECAAGPIGFLCRESLRLTMCHGKWTDTPPPGQSMCRQAHQNLYP
jgi:hypothetical protein